MKRKSRKRLSRSARAKILAEMKKSGMTAKQIGRKYGISPWTVYGWRKRPSGKAGRRAKGSGRAAGIGSAALRAEIRAALPRILRDELARAITSMIGGGKRRRRRGKK